VSIVEDIVEYGKTVYRAGMDLATWSAQMVREFGQGVAQFLRQAFDRIVAAYRASRFADTTGAVNVFHGTPHKIPAAEGFKLTKVGTGEGAASYGWGLYFAENEEVAEEYKKNLSSFKWSVDGRPYDAKDIRHFAAATLQEYDSKEDALATLSGQWMDARKRGWNDQAKRTSDVIDAIESGNVGELTETPTGNIYTVDLEIEPE
jgi:hypothetical protein